MMTTPLNKRTVTLRLKCSDVCDLLFACHYVSRALYAMGEHGENTWDRLADRLDEILTESDKKQDVMM